MHRTLTHGVAGRTLATLAAALLPLLAACGGGDAEPDQAQDDSMSATGPGSLAQASSAGPSTLPAGLMADGAGGADAGPATGMAELQKFGAPDGMAGDLFGWSVASLGSLVVVGAPQESPAVGITDNPGKAYVFDASGSLVRQLVPASASERRRDDGYGRSVAAGGNIIAVGSPSADDLGNFAGEVFVFNAETGAQLAKLVPTGNRRNPADGSAFGSAVSVSADRIVVGAPGTFSNARVSTGAIYLYEAATRRLIARVIPQGARSIDNVGSSVAVAGGTVVAGAPFDDTRALDAGAVYVFNSADGTLRFKLTATDGAASDVFGFAVSTNGALVAVGAHQDDDRGAASGSVYLFNATTGALVRKIVPDDGGSSDQFGIAVNLVGNLLAVGAWGDLDGAGSVYLFDVTTGAQLGKFAASDAAPLDILGRSVAISNSGVIAGAPRDADRGADSGSVYRFGPPPPGTAGR